MLENTRKYEIVNCPISSNGSFVEKGNENVVERTLSATMLHSDVWCLPHVEGRSLPMVARP